jgi:hypothetical protein
MAFSPHRMPVALTLEINNFKIGFLSTTFLILIPHELHVALNIVTYLFRVNVLSMVNIGLIQPQ